MGIVHKRPIMEQFYSRYISPQIKHPSFHSDGYLKCLQVLANNRPITQELTANMARMTMGVYRTSLITLIIFIVSPLLGYSKSQVTPTTTEVGKTALRAS